MCPASSGMKLCTIPITSDTRIGCKFKLNFAYVLTPRGNSLVINQTFFCTEAARDRVSILDLHKAVYGLKSVHRVSVAPPNYHPIILYLRFLTRFIIEQHPFSNQSNFFCIEAAWVSILDLHKAVHRLKCP